MLCNKLNDNHLGKLKTLGGMTNISTRDLIMEALESTGLDEEVIKVVNNYYAKY